MNLQEKIGITLTEEWGCTVLEIDMFIFLEVQTSITSSEKAIWTRSFHESNGKRWILHAYIDEDPRL